MKKTKNDKLSSSMPIQKTSLTSHLRFQSINLFYMIVCVFSVRCWYYSRFHLIKTSSRFFFQKSIEIVQ